VEPGDDPGPGGGQHLVAAFQVGPAEVVGVEGAQLQVGAQRPVEDQDPLPQRLEEPGGHQAALRGAKEKHRPCQRRSPIRAESFI
jgi:hypothetical protein